MNKFLLIIFSVFCISLSAQTQPAATPCSITNTITIPVPASCSYGTSISFTTLNSNGGVEKHSPFFPMCNPTGNPVSDVWFKFRATSNSVKINIDSAILAPNKLKTPQFTLYKSVGNCKQPLPIKCFSGLPNSKKVQGDINELNPLEYYYLQISGATAADTGAFRLTITPYDSCSCLNLAYFNVDPAPVAGYYNPGEKVTVCVGVVGFNSASGNSLHSVIPQFGSGWDLSSISNINNTPTIDGLGKWSFYPSGVNTPAGIKAGFFYESGGSVSNPADNKGDYGTNTDIWLFCFDIKVKPSCVQEQDLFIKFDLYHDGITSTVNSTNNCPSPNTLHFMAKQNCCLPNATLNITPADCNESCDGQVIANLNTPSQGPFNYQWHDQFGSLQVSNMNTTNKADTFSSVCVNLNGDYVLYVTDTGTTSCSYYKSFKVGYPADVSPFQTYFGCIDKCENTGTIIDLSASYNFHKATWTNKLPFGNTYTGTATLTDSMCAGFYEVDILDTVSGCTRTLEWLLFDSPPSNPYFSYPKNNFCSSETGIKPDSIATSGGYFYSIPGGYVDSISGALLFNTSTPTNITVHYVTGGNKCKDTSGVTITVSTSPPAPSGKANYTTCSFDTLTMNVTSGGTSNTILWYNQPYSTSITPFANGPSVQHQFFSPGTHLIYVYNETTGCRSQPFIITVTVDEGTADAGPDIEICSGNSTQFNATGGNSYLWVPSTFLSDDQSPTPTCTADSSISYLLKVISQSTCPGYDTLNVRVINSDDCIDIKPVNAFSPNSDGVNDFWFIRGIENSENEVSIFSRWGGLVWKTKNYDNSTNTFVGKDSNGKLLAANTYFYLISINNAKYTGWIEIVR